MKYCIFIGLFLFYSEFSFGQFNSDRIEEKLTKYFQATESKNWETVLNLINPKIFKLTPRKVIEQMYRQMDRKASMLIRFENTKILNYRPELILLDTSYIPIDYSQNLYIQVNPHIYKTKKQLKTLYEGFELSYLGQGIEFDPKNHQFILDSKNTLIASSPVGQDVWTFWEYRPNDPMTRLILPIEVIERLERGWIGN